MAETIGVLFYGDQEDAHTTYLIAPLEGLGYTVTARWAEGNAAQLENYAAELADRDVIVASDTKSAQAALEKTDRPVVVVLAGDPVLNGLNPTPWAAGGDITGTAFDTGMIPANQRTWQTDTGELRLKVVQAFHPQLQANQAVLSSVAVIYNDDEPAAEIAYQKIDTAATQQSITTIQAEVTGHNPHFKPAIEKAKQADWIFCINDPIADQSVDLAAGTADHPTIYESTWYIHAPNHGLAALVPSRTGGFPALLWRAAFLGDYVAKNHLVRGQLPAMEPLHRKLVVNTAAAAALHLVPPPNGSVIPGTSIRVEYYTPS